MNTKIQVLASPSLLTLGNESASAHCSRSIVTFNHEQFGQIRICQNEGKEWFCLSDVCKALEIGNPRQLKTRLQQRGVTTNDTPTYNQHGTMVMQKLELAEHDLEIARLAPKAVFLRSLFCLSLFR